MKLLPLLCNDFSVKNGSMEEHHQKISTCANFAQVADKYYACQWVLLQNLLTQPLSSDNVSI
jgi:hypothetical protein